MENLLTEGTEFAFADFYYISGDKKVKCVNADKKHLASYVYNPEKTIYKKVEVLVLCHLIRVEIMAKINAYASRIQDHKKYGEVMKLYLKVGGNAFVNNVVCVFAPLVYDKDFI